MLEFGTCFQERIKLFCICIEIFLKNMFMGIIFAVNIFSECVCEMSYKARDYCGSIYHKFLCLFRISVKT